MYLYHLAFSVECVCPQIPYENLDLGPVRPAQVLAKSGPGAQPISNSQQCRRSHYIRPPRSQITSFGSPVLSSEPASPQKLIEKINTYACRLSSPSRPGQFHTESSLSSMASSLFSLTGQNALVTGASRGVGKSAAIGLAEAGATVCLVYRRGSDDRATLHELEQKGFKAVVVEASLDDLEDVSANVHPNCRSLFTTFNVLG
jgi:hypothetical protein